MRKLTPPEINACRFLAKQGGSWTPGDVVQAKGGDEVVRVLRSLARKGRVVITETDDGPQFTLTEQGRADAS